MSGSKFVYVTYIRATREKIWDALTKPEFTKQYWSGTTQKSDFKKGSSWSIYAPDGRLFDEGEILEVDYPRKLVLSWRNVHFAEMAAEGHTRLTYELEPFEGDTKLTLTHEHDVEHSKTIAAVSNGWPPLLASLKSLLETGKPLEGTTKWPKDV
jgi:uncharacterized protein YndB with AHSA1/START domain